MVTTHPVLLLPTFRGRRGWGPAVVERQLSVCPVRAARTNLLTRPLKRSKASACGAKHSQNCAIRVAQFNKLRHSPSRPTACHAGRVRAALVELLRDLYVWAYERSTQEYLAIKQELAEPDPTRLAYRELIKQTIREVVQHPHADTLTTIAQAIAQVPQADRDEVQALVVQELRRLHEGVLARYGLRPSELDAWRAAQRSL